MHQLTTKITKFTERREVFTVPGVLLRETHWLSPHSTTACIEVHPLSGVALKTSWNCQKAPKQRTMSKAIISTNQLDSNKST